MDPIQDSYRFAEQGVQMVMKTAQTILSSELNEEEQGQHIGNLRSVIENYIVNLSKLKHDIKLTQELKGNLKAATSQRTEGDLTKTGSNFLLGARRLGINNTTCMK